MPQPQRSPSPDAHLPKDKFHTHFSAVRNAETTLVNTETDRSAKHRRQQKFIVKKLRSWHDTNRAQKTWVLCIFQEHNQAEETCDSSGTELRIRHHWECLTEAPPSVKPKKPEFVYLPKVTACIRRLGVECQNPKVKKGVHSLQLAPTHQNPQYASKRTRQRNYRKVKYEIVLQSRLTDHGVGPE